MQQPAGFAEFASREYPRLVGALSLHCHDRQVAEEIAQEALVRAADRWTRVSAMAAPGAWTHRVGMNLATSWLRRRQAERRAHAASSPRRSWSPTPSRRWPTSCAGRGDADGAGTRAWA